MALEWDDLQDWQKIAVGSFIYFVIAVVFYTHFLKPRLNKIKNIRGELTSAGQQVTNLEKEVKENSTKKEQLEVETARVESLGKNLYREDQEPQAMKDMTSRIAHGLNINFSLIEPALPQVKENYKTKNVRVSFNSSYIDMLSYFARASENPAVKIVSVMIAPSTQVPNMVDVQVLYQLFLLPKVNQAESGPAEKIAEKKETSGKPVNPFQMPGASGEAASGNAAAVAEEPLPDLKLNGIWEGAVTKAIINGKIVKVGDEIAGCQVKQIGKKQVILLWKHREIVLKP